MMYQPSARTVAALGTAAAAVALVATLPMAMAEKPDDCPSPPPAPPPPPGADKETPWDALPESCIDTGDTAWMLAGTTFVMLQTPGMGLAQAGLIRRKNALSMLMQIMTGLCLGSVLWYFFGYSLTFGPSDWSNGFIGDFSNSVFAGVPITGCFRFAPTIPGTVFASFQMMFALMVPMIVTGAFAEKMKFEAFLLFTVLWPVFVYYPIASWVWNPSGFLGAAGAFDFAGGITIHTPAGVSSLVVALMMVKRRENFKLGHHNLPLTIVGGILVWAGWYSFNGASAFGANAIASQALLNTHVAACVAGMTWVVLLYVFDKDEADGKRKWHLTEILSGALAGLAAVTPGSGFIHAWAAGIIGLIAGLVARGGLWLIKDQLKIDDVLDVMALQGFPGIVGSLLAAFFADPAINSIRTGVFYAESGVDEDCDGTPAGGALFAIQLGAVVLSATWAAFWTFLIMLLLKYTVGIDVDPETEARGLDYVQIGEQAYDEELDELLDQSFEDLVIRLCEAAAAGDLSECQRLIRANQSLASSADYDGRTPMHLAAAEGRVPVMKLLHQSYGVSIEDPKLDRWGGSPLADAIAGRRSAAVQYLRDEGAELTDEEITRFFGQLMHQAAEGEDKEVQRLLDGGVPVDSQDYDGRTILMVAAAEGMLKTAKVILKRGPDLDLKDRWGNTALDEATRHHEKKIAALIRKKGGDTGVSSDESSDEDAGKTKKNDKKSHAVRDLNNAVASGDIAEVKRAVARGADVTAGDYDLRTALHVAAAGGFLDIVQFLCSQKKVNVNAVDRIGQTALQDAINNGHGHVAAWLRENGAIVTNRQQGYDMCGYAHANNIKKLQELEQGGVDINVGDYDCRTALHVAASEGNAEIVKFIIGVGGFIAPKDRYGNTPLDDAVRHKHKKVASLLQGAMAQAGVATDDVDLEVESDASSEKSSSSSASDTEASSSASEESSSEESSSSSSSEEEAKSSKKSKKKK